LDACAPLRDAHGDLLGFIADCELGIDPPVVRGGYCATAGGILESYGVEVKSQMETFMADGGGMAACSSQIVCATYARRYSDYLR
jgi:hypothetical protein